MCVHTPQKNRLHMQALDVVADARAYLRKGRLWGTACLAPCPAYLGLISSAFWLLVICALEGSEKACAFMMRSMLADLPYLLTTTTQGVVAKRVDTCAQSSRGNP